MHLLHDEYVFSEGPMFNLVADENSQNLGINIHKKRQYLFRTDFLAGSVWHDSTHESFFLGLEPNYEALKSLTSDEQTSAIQKHFNAARSQTIAIGTYDTLDVIHTTVEDLEKWYIRVLEKQGAAQRFLRAKGNHFHLIADETASSSKFGDAIMQARNVQAFNMMHENMPLDYETLVGRIMPVFMQALGLEGYHVSHDLSKEAHGEVRFILDELAVFSIYKPQKEKGPAFLERYSYQHGDYFRTFAGEASGDVVKKVIFEWLVDAAHEQRTLHLTNPAEYLDQLTLDVRKSWVQGEQQAQDAIFEKRGHPSIGASENVLRLGNFRPH